MADSKPVKQEVNSTVIFPLLVFPVWSNTTSLLQDWLYNFADYHHWKQWWLILFAILNFLLDTLKVYLHVQFQGAFLH